MGYLVTIDPDTLDTVCLNYKYIYQYTRPIMCISYIFMHLYNIIAKIIVHIYKYNIYLYSVFNNTEFSS